VIYLTDTNPNEHYIKRGAPNKPTYYIIRPPYPLSGLFFNVVTALGHIRHALSKEQFPVVDWQNYPNAYLAPEKLGKENAWEYYFEQPLRIGLKEAYNGENVILSNTDKKLPSFPSSNISFEEKDSMLTEWRMLIKKGLLTIKSDIMREVLSIREKLFLQNDRVLGVKLRGTDYVANKPKWHYIPPHIISHRYCSYQIRRMELQ